MASGPFRGAAMRTEHHVLAATSDLRDTAGIAKRIATLRARAALVGAQIVESYADDGGLELILTRWSLTRAFRDSEFDDLERTLDRMGAPA